MLGPTQRIAIPAYVPCSLGYTPYCSHVLFSTVALALAAMTMVAYSILSLDSNFQVHLHGSYRVVHMMLSQINFVGKTVSPFVARHWFCSSARPASHIWPFWALQNSITSVILCLTLRSLYFSVWTLWTLRNRIIMMVKVYKVESNLVSLGRCPTRAPVAQLATKTAR